MQSSKTNTERRNTEEKKSIQDMISLALRAVCAAMGIAVVVLSILGAIRSETAVILLGIGVACAGISLLDRQQ